MTNKFDDIQLNRIRLDACPRHNFEVNGVVVDYGATVRCSECKGEMPLIEASQYLRGFEAAGGDASLLWAGWKEPGEPMQTKCPQCLGRCYVEPRPNDYFDCDLCSTTGHVNVDITRMFFNKRIN